MGFIATVITSFSGFPMVGAAMVAWGEIPSNNFAAGMAAGTKLKAKSTGFGLSGVGNACIVLVICWSAGCEISMMPFLTASAMLSTRLSTRDISSSGLLPKLR